MRIWDRFIIEGEQVLFAASVAIIKVLQPQILNKPFEEIAYLLTRGIDTIAPQIPNHEIILRLIDELNPKINLPEIIE